MQSIAKITLEVVLVAALSAFAATFGPWALGATIVVSSLGLLWLHGYLPLNRPGGRRKGRKGLLNLRTEVPRRMIAQDMRLHTIAELCGRLVSVLQRSNSLLESTADDERVAAANRVAAAIRPLATKMRNEAARLQTETTELSTGLARWLEIAERERVPYGLTEQIPWLVKTLKSGAPVFPVLQQTRNVFEKLRGASDTLDASCGEVVDALDVVTAATKETVSASESALRRIKALLEREAQH